MLNLKQLKKALANLPEKKTERIRKEKAIKPLAIKHDRN